MMRLALMALALLSMAQSPAPPAFSSSDAQSLSRKLQAIERRKQMRITRPESILVTEGELNSYLNLDPAAKLPRGVSEVVVRLDRDDRVQARGMVDLESVKPKVPWIGFGPLMFFGGNVPVEIKGRLRTSGDGFGSIEVEDLRMASIPVPISVLEQLVSTSTRTEENPQGFDIRAPFRLPYSVKRVRLEPGQGYLDF
jgi:hypothetical protein